MEHDAIGIQFNLAFNAAAQLYNDEKFEECVEALKNLLDDPAIPRYHRIKCLALLGGTLGDWTEAYGCYVTGETLWRITRRWHVAGANNSADDALDDLHEDLEELRRALVADHDWRCKSIPDPDHEADVLRGLVIGHAAEDRAIAIAEAEE